MALQHAYLIMAHNNFYILEKLIRLIDDERNDIYLHIDLKVTDFDFEYFKNLTTYSNITFVNRVKVNWGSYSLVRAEMELLKAAVTKSYQYYHILSGVDLPLKTQDEIHEFCDFYHGKEFVNYFTEKFFTEDKRVYRRASLYHFLQEYRKCTSNQAVNDFITGIDRVFLFLQIVLRINRLKKKDFVLKGGSNWVSITDDFAQYIVSKEDWIHTNFKKTSFCDELFVQTLLYNSSYKDNVYLGNTKKSITGNLRMIDWSRGNGSNPYVWHMSDYNTLIQSNNLFARKFDVKIDKDIVDTIYENIVQKSQLEEGYVHAAK